MLVASRLVILFTLILIACQHENEDSYTPDLKLADIAALIESNKLLWEASNINSYIFTYTNYSSDCPTRSPYPPVVITVSEDVVTSVFVPDFGIFIDKIESYPTIDQLFVRMEKIVEGEPELFGRIPASGGTEMPLFNTQYGYPESYYVDKRKGETCDAERMSVSDFQ